MSLQYEMFSERRTTFLVLNGSPIYIWGMIPDKLDKGRQAKLNISIFDPTWHVIHSLRVSYYFNKVDIKKCILRIKEAESNKDRRSCEKW